MRDREPKGRSRREVLGIFGEALLTGVVAPNLFLKDGAEAAAVKDVVPTATVEYGAYGLLAGAVAGYAIGAATDEALGGLMGLGVGGVVGASIGMTIGGMEDINNNFG